MRVAILMPRQYRSGFAIFRCGVGSVRLETGRRENLSWSSDSVLYVVISLLRMKSMFYKLVFVLMYINMPNCPRLV